MKSFRKFILYVSTQSVDYFNFDYVNCAHGKSIDILKAFNHVGEEGGKMENTTMY